MVSENTMKVKASNFELLASGKPAPPADLQLQKMFGVLVADKGLGAVPAADPKLVEPKLQQDKRQPVHSNGRHSI